MARDAWTEADSRGFLALGRYFVPAREAQIATVVGAIPAVAAPVHLVDLCAGEGLLTEALLERFPAARVHAFDGSAAMLAALGRRLARHGERLETRAFDLAGGDWRRLPWRPHAVVSSLAVHHLSGAEKAGLYADMARLLAPGGALVIADLIAPLSAEARAIAATQWDQAVARQTAGVADGAAARDRFAAERWNFYRDPEPDPIDRPSPLTSQLRWLEAAGLVAVEVYWLVAGHAIFGGRKPG